MLIGHRDRGSVQNIADCWPNEQTGVWGVRVPNEAKGCMRSCTDLYLSTIMRKHSYAEKFQIQLIDKNLQIIYDKSKSAFAPFGLKTFSFQHYLAGAEYNRATVFCFDLLGMLASFMRRRPFEL